MVKRSRIIPAEQLKLGVGSNQRPRNQNFFSFSNLREPCNHPNFYTAVEIRESCVHRLRLDLNSVRLLPPSRYTRTYTHVIGESDNIDRDDLMEMGMWELGAFTLRSLQETIKVHGERHVKAK